MATSWIEGLCPAPSAAHAEAARLRQASLTKPPGSLGVLEVVAIDLAALQAVDLPRAAHAPILLFAGDHGITAQGVSAFPSAVTVEMLKNFAAGGAAISVLARELGSTLTVVDVGTLAAAPVAGVFTDKPRAGTRDFSIEPALTADEVQAAFDVGQRTVARAARGADLVLFGEMGIGNTTSAAALAAALMDVPAADVTGAGTGLEVDAIGHKARVIDAALAQRGLRAGQVSARAALQGVGGLEIAALSGAMIAAAQARVPVLVDGFIVSVAALVACRLNASVRPWLLFSHVSAEQGHRRVLAALEARPILDLGLRLGEGSGAAVALSVVRLACALHAGMATFEEAAVSGRST